MVVNCFQNGIFLRKSQQELPPTTYRWSCELLSKWYLPKEITAVTSMQGPVYSCELLSKWYLPKEITAYPTLSGWYALFYVLK